MRRQNNLDHNCMSKFISPKIDIIIDNYLTVTNTKNLDEAFRRVEEIKGMTNDIIDEQMRNMEEAEKLMENTQNIKWESQEIEKGSKKLENIMKSQEFWLCSRRCILMFLAIGIVLTIIIGIIVAATGGSSDDDDTTS